MKEELPQKGGSSFFRRGNHPNTRFLAREAFRNDPEAHK